MRNIRYIVVFTLLLSLGACEESKVDITRFGSISGLVVDGENYAPLQGVLISTSPASSTMLTDGEGRFRIDKIRTGDVVITARRKDFLSNNVTIAVFEDEHTNLTFFMLKDERNVGSVIIFDPVPGNGAVNQPLSFTFQWNVDQQFRDRQLTYTVYIFESNSTVQTIVGENLLSRQVVVSGLKENTTYFWYVVAKFEGRNVANSPTWSFRTSG